MHVVWINELAYPKGGAERYVAETAARLRAHGVRSTLLYDVESPVDPGYLSAFEGAYPQVDRPMQIRELAPDIVYVHRIDEGGAITELSSSRAPVIRFFHDYKLFCLREHKYTAVGQRTCTRPAGLSCYPCLGFVQRDRRAGASPKVKLVSLGALRRAQRRNHDLSAYVVGSTYMRDHVAAHGFDRSKIHVLPLYAEPPSGQQSSRREPDLVLFVGQLIRGKGVDLLLRAIARTRRGRLLTAGQGDQRVELEALAASLGLGDRVVFTGKLDKAEIEALHGRARCLAMPSRYPDTFGLAGLEALASGLPVVAADVGGVREWLVHRKNGLIVPSGDIDALARALDLLLSDDAMAEAMGRAAVATHRERFLPERHVSALHALFKRLVLTEAA